MTLFAQFDQADQQLGNLQNALEQMQQRIQGGLGNLGGSASGLMSYLPWIALAWIVYLVMRRGGGPTFALSDFQLNPTARVKDGVVIKIAGRQHGVIGRLISLVGMSPDMQWLATKDAVRLEYDSLFGRNVSIVPMRQICLIRTDYAIPAMMVALAAVLFLAGLFNFRSTMGLVGMAAGVGIAVYAFFNRRFVISVQAAAGGPVAFGFKPGMLGGPAFDMDKLEEAGRLLQKMVRANEGSRRENEEREPPPRGPTIPLAPLRAIESAPYSQKAAEHSGMPKEEGPMSAPIVSVFQPVGPPQPRPLRVKPRKRLPIQPMKRPEPNASNEEKLAAEAFDAAVRVFESKRPGEAEAAWWALVRRWPNTTAAKRAKRILDNRAKRERKKT